MTALKPVAPPADDTDMTIDEQHLDNLPDTAGDVEQCRVCGCTDDDCTECVERTGQPCWWTEPDLCSACVTS